MSRCYAEHSYTFIYIKINKTKKSTYVLLYQDIHLFKADFFAITENWMKCILLKSPKHYSIFSQAHKEWSPIHAKLFNHSFKGKFSRSLWKEANLSRSSKDSPLIIDPLVSSLSSRNFLIFSSTRRSSSTQSRTTSCATSIMGFDQPHTLLTS